MFGWIGKMMKTWQKKQDFNNVGRKELNDKTIKFNECHIKF